MRETYNIYCDESCHLENDHQLVMLLGAIWCPRDEVVRLSREMQDMKSRHKAAGELKWTKVSMARLDFYLELVDWFLAETPLHFRSLVVLHKERLNHVIFNEGSHDDFYYKMYFSLLSKILSPDQCYNVYLDIKDTRSRLKMSKLREVLCNDKYDFTSQMIGHLQNIRSHESYLLQICDFLLGAVSYRHRGLAGNAAKVTIINYLEERLGRALLHSTPLREEKFNLFLFTPREGWRT
ncbi:conserved hypothetical protein [Nitrosococcus halophilus Nc 4]|uniref:DUF3800 domain-containing protein n=1 Tax=Nitrosococcus halophilus (strain Nc4) TaxID=472759 RepID=D5BY86_NITHN|nr:DUF3800 domain-containing protein [Nitrosococcus halophilus]ADE14069.1 conserved hypothetical protein [Nitrosococcus halophilus Nc 4]